MKTLKSALTWSVVVTTIAWSVGASLLVAPLAAGATATLTAGSLIKGSLPAVYYYGGDGKRYVFPNEATYKTWYADFAGVQTITDADLAAVTIGGNVTYKPGVKMVKITTDPKVYAVDAHGTLRHIASETVAVALYGASWAGLVNDVPDAFFVNYTVGTAVAAAADFAKDTVAAAATSINVDKNLGGAVVTPTPVTGTVTVSDGGSPAGATVPGLSSDVVFAKVKITGTGTLKTLKVTRGGLGVDANISGVKIYDGTTQVGTTQTLNSSHQAAFNNLNIAVSGEKLLTIAGDIATVATGSAVAGHMVKLGIASAADVTLASGTVGGTFPIYGGEMTVAAVTIGTAELRRGSLMPQSDSNVAPDATDFRFTQVRVVAGSTEDITIKQIVAIQSGTANVSDLKDIKLHNDTKSELVKTVPTLSATGRATFDGLNIVVKKGEGVDLSIIASMTGGSSSSRTVGFELHDGVAYTISIVGNTYGFGLTPTRLNTAAGFCSSTSVSGTYHAADANGTCLRQTVSTGTLRFSRASSSPATGKVAQGATQVPLLAVEYTATGEAVRISSQRFNFVFADDFVYSELTSLTLYDSTGNIVAGPMDLTDDTAPNAHATFTDTVTIPAGTSALTLKGNIATTAGDDGDATADSVTATLAYTPMTVKGDQSGKAATVSTTSNVAGLTQSISAASLASVTTSLPIAGTVIAGTQDFGFANVNLDASAGGEDVRVTQMVFADTTGVTALPGNLVNFELWGDPDTSDATDVSQRIETSNSTSAATNAVAGAAGDDSTITFTFKAPIRISKLKGATYQLRADIVSTAVTDATSTHTLDLSTITATGFTTGTTVTSTPAGAGQIQTVAASGLLKVELAADRAAAGPIVAGTTGVSVMKYKLTASFEDVDVTEIPVFLADGQTGTGVLPNVARFKLYADGQLVGSTSGYTFGNDAEKNVVLDPGTFVVLKDTAKFLEIKLDFNTKSEVFSGTALRVGIGDDDGDATSGWGAAASATVGYNIVAKGRGSGATIDQNDIDSVGTANNTTGTIDGGRTLAVFDGVLAIALDSVSPSGVQTGGPSVEVLRFALTANGDQITVRDLEFVPSGTATLDSVVSTLELYGGAVTYASFSARDWGTGGAAQISVTGDDTDNAFNNTLEIGAGTTVKLSLKISTSGATANQTLSIAIGGTGVVDTTSGVEWQDSQLDGLAGTCTYSIAGSTITLTAAATNGDGTTAVVQDNATTGCVVDNATYTKTLPMNGHGLSY